MTNVGQANARAGSLGATLPSEALRQLRRQEITLDEYLNICVENAVTHLVGCGDEEQLQFVRQLLRDRLMSDPILQGYLRDAMGSDEHATRA